MKQEHPTWTVTTFSILFGTATWLSVNGVWVEVPQLTASLPEGWTLSAHVAVLIQLGNIAPIAYIFLNRPKMVWSIYIVMTTGILALLLLSNLWSISSFFLGKYRAVPLLVLVFVLACVDCTSRVLYLPFMARLHASQLTAFFVGEGLGGLLPGLLSLLQGNTCSGEPVYLSVSLFFYLLALINVLGMLGFHILNQYCPPEIDPRLEQVEEKLPLVPKEHIRSRVSIVPWLCLLTAISCLANGAFPAIQSYSALPYGNKMYHLIVTLSLMANPVVCFIILFSSYRWIMARVAVIVSLLVSIPFGLYILIVALNGPVFDAAFFMVVSWVMWVALCTHCKISIASMMRESHGERGLFWTGVCSQAGSSAGALITFMSRMKQLLLMKRNLCVWSVFTVELINSDLTNETWLPMLDTQRIYTNSILSESMKDNFHILHEHNFMLSYQYLIVIMGSIIDCDEDILRRRRNFALRRSLSEYGVSFPTPPNDVLEIRPKDDKFRFFKKGRDFQPRRYKHEFTEDELRILETYESAAILPSHSEVYRKWLQAQPPRKGREDWMLIFLVAVITGFLAFCLTTICERLPLLTVPPVKYAIEIGSAHKLWLSYSLISCAFSGLSAVIIIYVCPNAAGSGLPEIIGILNGCVVRNVLGLKTLVCKIVSVCLTVMAKLPVGFEGPMVHIGAMVGACMAKPMRPKTSNSSVSCKCPVICRYRDCYERYSLLCMGAASGIAAAFSSPMSGVTFAMEEISSHWSRIQTWQTFACCIIARGTMELLKSAELCMFRGPCDAKFKLSESALFDMKVDLKLSWLIFIPAVILGVAGGLLGALNIFMHLKFSKLRRRMFSIFPNATITNVLKLIEVILIAFICATIVCNSLGWMSCKQLDEYASALRVLNSIELKPFKCANGSLEYHDGASLLLNSWEQLFRNLLSRKTGNMFSIQSLLLCFLILWLFSSWVSMTSVSSGLLIPQLAIGALYGRTFAEVMRNFGWWEKADWTDPGAFALMGAASFLSGTSRLPITSVVLMLEMTNDINMCLLIMLCVMLSKFVGDKFTHSLYHSMLEIKCIPYMEPCLQIYYKEKRVSLELFTASLVMKSPVQYVNVRESIAVLANMLLDTNHGAFPVVLPEPFQKNSGNKYLGIISRLELTILLTKTENFEPQEIGTDDMDRIRISYPEYSSNKLEDAAMVTRILNKFSTSFKYRNIMVDLMPYTNVSAPSVPINFCLRRTYMMFMALGLRHLVVTNRRNEVVGIITRKDLLGYAVEKKVAEAYKSVYQSLNGEHCCTGIRVQTNYKVPVLEEVE